MRNAPPRRSTRDALLRPLAARIPTRRRAGRWWAVVAEITPGEWDASTLYRYEAGRFSPAAGQVVHPRLHGRRPEPPGIVGFEAECARGGPRRIPADQVERAGADCRRTLAFDLAADAPLRPGPLGTPRHQRPQ